MKSALTGTILIILLLITITPAIFNASFSLKNNIDNGLISDQTVIDSTNNREILINKTLCYMKNKLPILYDLIINHDLQPSEEEETAYLNTSYVSFSLAWSLRKRIYISARILIGAGKIFIVGIYARLSKDTVNHTSARGLVEDINRLVGESLPILTSMGFSVEPGTGYVTYNGTRLVLLCKNGVWGLMLRGEFEDAGNAYMLFYDNYAGFLQQFQGSSWRRLEWRINNSEAVQIALDKAGLKYSYGLKTMIKKYITVLNDGLYPIYRVVLVMGDQYWEVFINAYNGGVLASNSGAITGVNNSDEWINALRNSLIICGLITGVLVIVFSTLLLWLIKKRKS